MLAQFTWLEFLVAAAVITLVWYVAVVLLFYRKWLKAFLSRSASDSPKEPLPHRWKKEVEELSQKAENSPVELLGKSKLPQGMSKINMGQIGFSHNDDAKIEQVGLVPDVLQELKEIFVLLEKEDGSKSDFFELMVMVRDKYGQIGSNPNIVRINEFIAAHAPFHLSPEELENLWD